MKLNNYTSYNQNFGYNKRLNTKLRKKLAQEPNNKIYQSVSRINDICNETEEAIRKFEKKDRSGVEINKDKINFYADFFISAKIELCRMVDKLFPELNFFDTEVETYDKEAMELVSIEKGDKCDDELSPAYFWREMFVDEAYTIKDIQEEAKISTNSQTKGLIDITSSANSKENTKNSSLVEKFLKTDKTPKGLEDVVGLKNCIEDVKDLIIFPLEHPEEALKRKEDYGIEVPGFTILFGPPGCGKTMLAQAIASEVDCDMYSFDLSKIGSAYVNQTANNIQEAYDYVKKEADKSQKPVIIFMDEMDSFLTQRSDNISRSSEDNKAVNALLPILSDTKKDNIMVIGATNMYDTIDSAVKRRADFSAYIGLPNEKEIKKLLVKTLSKVKMGETLSKDEEALNKLSLKLLGYSPSNIVTIFKDASKNAYKNNREITFEDFDKAIKNTNFDKIDEKKYLPENKKESRKMGFTFNA